MALLSELASASGWPLESASASALLLGPAWASALLLGLRWVPSPGLRSLLPETGEAPVQICRLGATDDRLTVTRCLTASKTGSDLAGEGAVSGVVEPREAPQEPGLSHSCPDTAPKKPGGAVGLGLGKSGVVTTGFLRASSSLVQVGSEKRITSCKRQAGSGHAKETA